MCLACVCLCTFVVCARACRCCWKIMIALPMAVEEMNHTSAAHIRIRHSDPIWWSALPMRTGNICFLGSVYIYIYILQFMYLWGRPYVCVCMRGALLNLPYTRFKYIENQTILNFCFFNIWLPTWYQVAVGSVWFLYIALYIPQHNNFVFVSVPF